MTDNKKPISEIIRQRVIDAKAKYFSTDNISAHIKEGEIDLLIDEVESKFEEVLKSLVIDTEADHNSAGTARRVSKMFLTEIFSGRYEPAPAITTFPNIGNSYDQLYVVGPLTVRSTCAHHLQPITGKAYIGIFPGENVLGLSKFARILEHIASRPHIQEELTVRVADEIEKVTKASGVAVLIIAEHGCMVNRGVKEHASDMTTSIMRGKFREDPSLKAEFMAIVSRMS